MTARAAFARLVYEDETMQGLGFIQERVFAANAADTPGQSEPFIVITSEGIEKSFGSVGPTLVSFWVHIPTSIGRDYWIIDEALDRIKILMLDVTHLAGSDGYVLTGASWVDTSRDLADDGYNTLTKYSTFRAACHSMVTP